jgi:glycosyltransferase involved in cell wall biosynthesis
MSVGGLQHPDPSRHIAELATVPRELPLVLVGSTRPWVHELGGVHLTGGVSDEDLACLYSGAHALVLSSESEAFGLAGVEALACGTPVAAFESPALREGLGDGIAFVEGGDVAGLIAAAESSRRPAPAAPRWSWEDAARATWRVYADALAEAADARTSGRAARGAGPLPSNGLGSLESQ